jgi:hypothetical protein
MNAPNLPWTKMNTANSPWTWSTTQGNGTPALADFLAQDPDHETYVFRKFKKLAVRNVLYLQGELTVLEEEVEILEREAGKSHDPEVHLSMRSWRALDENARRPSHESSLESRLRNVMGGLDGKLKTYCSLVFCSLGLGAPFMTDNISREDEALMLQRDIAMLESPSPRVLAALREWLHGSSRASNMSSKLDGRDREMFSVGSDLVALTQDKDPLSRLLHSHWPFHWPFSSEV